MFIWKCIKYGFLLRKYNKILNKVYKDESILENIEKTYGLKLECAWFGRLYAVLNPIIKNEKLNYENMIMELNDGRVSASEYMEKVVFEMLFQIKQFIVEKELFDMVMYKVTKLDNYGNFLFVLEPIPYEDFVYNFKKTLKCLGIISIILIVGLIAWFALT